MAKRAKARASRGPRRKPARRSRAAESLLLRSAESLGRVIGALQRQLEQAQTAIENDATRKKKKRRRSTR